MRVTNADIRADEKAQAAERARYPLVRVEGRARSPLYAEFLSQASRVRLDAAGPAWVRRWNRWGETTAEWIVFASRGAPIARVRMPAHFDANDIGRDFVLGIAIDEDGVQAIH